MTTRWLWCKRKVSIHIETTNAGFNRWWDSGYGEITEIAFQLCLPRFNFACSFSSWLRAQLFKEHIFILLNSAKKNLISVHFNTTRGADYRQIKTIWWELFQSVMQSTWCQDRHWIKSCNFFLDEGKWELGRKMDVSIWKRQWLHPFLLLCCQYVHG